jgi:pimeloyl-ACP methyl ester carboxylesterase
MGAGLGVLVASQHPEVVKQLILWMPTGLPGKGEVSFARRLCSMFPLLHRFMYRNYESARASIRGWIALHGFVDPARIPEEVLDVYTTCAQQYGAEHAIRNLYSGRLNIDIEERLATLSQPVTFLWPDPPPDGKASRPARLQSLAKGSRLVQAPRLSRLAAVENPAELASLLANELSPGPKVIT